MQEEEEPYLDFVCMPMYPLECLLQGAGFFVHLTHLSILYKY